MTEQVRSAWGSRAGVAAAGALALLLAGCGSGPDEIGSGSYRLWATSEASAEQAQPDAGLVIESSSVTLSLGSDSTTVPLGQPGDEYVVCPPSGTGAPQPLGAPMVIGDLELAEPAIFGDCGDASPRRVTVVDLSSVGDGQFPFQRWAEFCDIADADCS